MCGILEASASQAGKQLFKLRVLLKVVKCSTENNANLGNDPDLALATLMFETRMWAELPGGTRYLHRGGSCKAMGPVLLPMYGIKPMPCIQARSMHFLNSKSKCLSTSFASWSSLSLVCKQLSYKLATCCKGEHWLSDCLI